MAKRQGGGADGPDDDLGQHFLIAPEAIARIVQAAALQPGERVLDVGAGAGALTEAICAAVAPSGFVTAIELDPALASGLRRRRATNVQVVVGDALQVPWPQVEAVVANPPYRILSPLLFRIAKEGVGRAILVVPKELRDRLIAEPGTEHYGKLTIRLAARGKAESLSALSKHAFTPPPEVPSSLVRFVPTPPAGLHLDLFDQVVEAVWPARKKTNRHAFAPLDKILKLPPQDVTEALRGADAGALTPETTPAATWVGVVRGLQGAMAKRKPS